MKITYLNWYQKPVEITGISDLVADYVSPWQHRGAIEDLEDTVDELQQLVSRLIEVTAAKLQLDEVDLNKILRSRIVSVEYD